MKTLMLLLIVLGPVSLLFGQAPEQVPNLKRVTFEVYTSGQPTEEGFRQIAAKGIKTVINVLPERQCVANEKEMVSAAGMAYRSIPFELTGFRKETIRRFAEILDDAEKPVLIHCATGNHVGGIWFAMRILFDKYPLDQALLEGRKIGMKPELENEIFLWLITQDRLAFV